MKNLRIRKFLRHFAVACLCHSSSAIIGVSVAAAELPAFERVTAATTAYFQSLPDYQPNDLLSQQQVAGALDAIAQIGWDVPYREKIVTLALADDAFLVKKLATPAGKQFMRKIARNRGAYSRLDRLSKISGGHDAVELLINDPGGDTMITYMTTTPGGQNLGTMLADTPDGTNLNKPTGRIYTADELLALVKKIYAIEVEASATPSP